MTESPQIVEENGRTPVNVSKMMKRPRRRNPTGCASKSEGESRGWDPAQSNKEFSLGFDGGDFEVGCFRPRRPFSASLCSERDSPWRDCARRGSSSTDGGWGVCRRRSRRGGGWMDGWLGRGYFGPVICVRRVSLAIQLPYTLLQARIPVGSPTILGNTRSLQPHDAIRCLLLPNMSYLQLASFKIKNKAPIHDKLWIFPVAPAANC